MKITSTIYVEPLNFKAKVVWQAAFTVGYTRYQKWFKTKSQAVRFIKSMLPRLSDNPLAHPPSVHWYPDNENVTRSRYSGQILGSLQAENYPLYTDNQ